MVKASFDNNSNPLPWANRQSIFDYIKSHLNEYGILPQEYEKLPDDDDYFTGEQIRWEPGALDSMSGYFSQEQSQEKLERVEALIKKQLESPNETNKKELYLALKEDGLQEYIDLLLNYLSNEPTIDRVRFYEEALWLAKNGAHRGVVKTGIMMLSLFKCDDLSELLLTLGKHEEFTLYVIEAVRKGFSNANQKLFELAKCLDGWGKIHIVENISPDTQEIREWLLKHGCENKVMEECLAYICASKGGLFEALSEPHIDPELYSGASTIISALINSYPADDIDDYEYSMEVIVSYLHHSKTYCASLKDFLTLVQIKTYLEEDEEKWENRYNSGWNAATREKCLEECSAFIQKERWRSLIWDNLNSNDPHKQQIAVQVARILGIDVWNTLFAQLAIDPLNQNLYFNLMRTDDKNRGKQLIDFAERNLPLDEIAVDPTSESGFGTEFKPHNCLNNVLQYLYKFEGIGHHLILAGLKSPVTRNKELALKVLSSWNQQSWPAETVPTLVELVDIEPDLSIRSRMKELIEYSKK